MRQSTALALMLMMATPATLYAEQPTDGDVWTAPSLPPIEGMEQFAGPQPIDGWQCMTAKDTRIVAEMLMHGEAMPRRCQERLDLARIRYGLARVKYIATAALVAAAAGFLSGYHVGKQNR